MGRLVSQREEGRVKQRAKSTHSQLGAGRRRSAREEGGGCGGYGVNGADEVYDGVPYAHAGDVPWGGSPGSSSMGLLMSRSAAWR